MQEKISFRPVENFHHDGPAALVVFLVALPLCLGIALASGAPLFSGLIAGVVGGVLAGSLSKSSVSVSGPAAGLSTLVLASIQDLGSFPLFLTCVALAGIIQIILGYIRAGSIGHFFPSAVIKGMLAAIGLILILKQLPHAIGYDADYEGDESFFQLDGKNTFSEIMDAIDLLSPGAVFVATLSFVIFLLWQKLIKKGFRIARYVSAPLVVVLAGIILNQIFQTFFPVLQIKPSHLVDLGGSESSAITDLFTFPDVSQLFTTGTFQTALTIAVVASLETLLSIEALDKLDPYKRITPLNRELKAQGAANLVSGLFGGLPVTAVIVRGSANVMAGARTKTSTILHGILLAMAVLFIPGAIQLIPLASLAIILMMVGFSLTRPSLYQGIFRKGLDQFLPFIVTVIAILLSDILTGIFIGILVSVFFVLKTNFRTAIILVNNGNQYLLKFTKDVSFLHKSSLRTALEKVPDNSNLIVDGVKNYFVDHDILETLEDYRQGAVAKNISVEIKNGKNRNGHSLKTAYEK